MRTPWLRPLLDGNRGRRLAASATLLMLFAGYAMSMSRSHVRALDWLLIVPLALAAILVHVDRLLPQLFVQSVAWMHLSVATLAVALGAGRSAAYVGAASGLTLLALGTAPLTTPRTREEFHPLGHRSSFIAASVILVGTAQVLALGGLEWLQVWHRRAGALVFFEVTAIVLAVIGVVRMRAWGIFAALAAVGVGAFVAGLASIPQAHRVLGVVVGRSLAYDVQPLRIVFGVAALVSLSIVLPIVWSWIVPVREGAPDRERAWRRLHGGLVACGLVVAAVGMVWSRHY